jgi:hypothetical protein
MNYLMMPLDQHYDVGFGAVAEAFFRTARGLDDKERAKQFFFEHLPQNFLLRHAIELFLKSGIVIIHRKLKLPYGDGPYNSPPRIRIGDKWEPVYRVHSIGDLYTHWKSLITPNAEKLKSLCEFKPEWTVPSELDGWITTIEKTDPASTYYRYPANRDPNEDKNKSPFKETPPAEMFPANLAEGK